jgi:hypothetical protein
VYTHTIRSINHAMAMMKKKKKEEIRSFFVSFFLLLPKGHSIQSKKFMFLPLQSTNPFVPLAHYFSSFFLVRCTCCIHTNKEKLSCHRLYTEKRESNSLTEGTLDGGKSEFHLHSKLALVPATILSLY